MMWETWRCSFNRKMQKNQWIYHRRVMIRAHFPWESIPSWDFSSGLRLSLGKLCVGFSCSSLLPRGTGLELWRRLIRYLSSGCKTDTLLWRNSIDDFVSLEGELLWPRCFSANLPGGRGSSLGTSKRGQRAWEWTWVSYTATCDFYKCLCAASRSEERPSERGGERQTLSL